MAKRMRGAVLDAIRNFDHLPNTAYVPQGVVEALYGVSSATIWRRVQAGQIPKPHRFPPRTTRWQVGELRRALAGG